MPITEKFKHWLAESVDGHVIGAFRLIFGLFMVYNTWSYHQKRLIEDGLLAPKIHFKFEGFGWVDTLPLPAMQAIMVLMGLSALLLAAGVFFRWSCWVLSLCLAFLMFQDKSYFNNHIYLFVLLPVLLSFTNADRFFSLGKKTNAGNLVPRWQQFILQAQIVIVYFYGGLAKTKHDWLFDKEPVTSLIGTFPDSHWLAPYFKTEFAINLLTYGGFAIDLLAPLLLWYRPVRKWGLPLFVGFHFSNSRIFDDIGIFPFVMIATMILFFETRELPVLRRWASDSTKAGKSTPAPQISSLSRNFLIGFFVFQLLFPFRGFFLPNSMDWTSIGKNFSWRMKIDTRPIEQFDVTIHHPVTGQIMPVDVRSFVNEMQVLNMACDPRSLVAFARLLREEAARRGVEGALVKARIMVRYNGRPPQLFVDPDVDLASVSCSPFETLEWVYPLTE
ncbi:MAG: HTTM domain-containing protein [Lewinellaceae bacterium]|nr:HTTM domain-containing protein [Lewinellaceae bacterium]